jgi:hypothetical protein
MNEIDHFKNFVLYSDDVTSDIDHLHMSKKLISEFLLYSYRGYDIKRELGVQNSFPL